VNYAEIIRDKQGQSAYEIFSIKRGFRNFKSCPPAFRKSSVWGRQTLVHFKMHASTAPTAAKARDRLRHLTHVNEELK